MGFLVVVTAAPVAFNFAYLNGYQWWAQAFPPLTSVSIVMAMKYGNPLNWWVPYFGTTMFANKTRLTVREQAGENSDEIQQEIQAWVSNCAKGRSWKINPYTYRFLRKGDAAFFKLAWG